LSKGTTLDVRSEIVCPPKPATLATTKKTWKRQIIL